MHTLWHGWHCRNIEEDVLHYWSGEVVTICPSLICEAVIWVHRKSQPVQTKYLRDNIEVTEIVK